MQCIVHNANETQKLIGTGIMLIANRNDSKHEYSKINVI